MVETVMFSKYQVINGHWNSLMATDLFSDKLDGVVGE